MPRAPRLEFACPGLLLIGLLMGAGATYAQLLSNTGFDVDVSGWLPGVASTILWDPLDSDASSTSGSALLTNSSNTPGDATGSTQCAPGGIVGGRSYRVGAQVYFPDGQSETGSAEILVQWYSAPSCSGFIKPPSVSSDVQSSTAGAWQSLESYVTARPGSRSARVRLTITKNESGGSLAAHFDRVVLEEVVFVDDFESGNTSAWSSSVP